MFRRMAPPGNSLYGKISPDSNETEYDNVPHIGRAKNTRFLKIRKKKEKTSSEANLNIAE